MPTRDGAPTTTRTVVVVVPLLQLMCAADVQRALSLRLPSLSVFVLARRGCGGCAVGCVMNNAAAAQLMVLWHS